MTRVAALLLTLATAPAVGHPLPNMRFDRTVHVRLAPSGVTVRYTLELNDWTMALDGSSIIPRAEAAALTGPQAYAVKYAEKKAPLLADNLRATRAGKALMFRTEKIEVGSKGDHAELRFTFRSDWQPEPGERQAFAFEDQNFEDRSGTVALTLDAIGEGLTLVESDDPAGLRNVNPRDLKPGEERKLRQASAVFEIPASQEGETRPVADAPRSPVIQFTPSDQSLFEALRDRGLTALFDSGVGLGLMLLLALLFGVAHAFTPGHGKTMVAAYLVGERGTVTHAVVLGVVATVAHTGSVITLAVGIYLYYGNEPPAAAQGWLMLAGGLLIAGVGLWLFLQRARGRADHVHLFGDHHHHHGDHNHHHGPPPESAATGVGWTRVILLGLGGGIIPCWDAVLLFLVALTRGRVGLAIPLLLAFSLGLAAVLIALGVGVVYANRAGGRRFGEQRWFQLLPVLSAVVLVGLGLWFVRDGYHALAAAEKARTVVTR
jgi:ABC-type nickel/cobalt efflux system permease component RcnA